MEDNFKREYQQAPQPASQSPAFMALLAYEKEMQALENLHPPHLHYKVPGASRRIKQIAKEYGVTVDDMLKKRHMVEDYMKHNHPST